MTLSEAVSRCETRVGHSRTVSGMGLPLPQACSHSSREPLLGIGSDRVHTQKKLKCQRTLACRMREMFSPAHG